MNFTEAEKLLRLDKKVRRKEWHDDIFLKMDEIDNVKCFRKEAIPFSYNLSIIISHDWVVIGEGDDFISFTSALDALLKGKLVKLKEWPLDCYLEATQNGKEVFMRRICEYDFTPTFECFTSDDWIIVE